MEAKFFGHSAQKYIFDPEKPSVVDLVFYQELLSAMILTGLGTHNEFFKHDYKTQLNDLPKLTKWYKTISAEYASQ
jgi:hypothetical protein